MKFKCVAILTEKINKNSFKNRIYPTYVHKNGVDFKLPF